MEAEFQLLAASSICKENKISIEQSIQILKGEASRENGNVSDEILMFDHSNESYGELLFYVNVICIW